MQTAEIDSREQRTLAALVGIGAILECDPRAARLPERVLEQAVAALDASAGALMMADSGAWRLEARLAIGPADEAAVRADCERSERSDEPSASGTAVTMRLPGAGSPAGALWLRWSSAFAIDPVLVRVVGRAVSLVLQNERLADESLIQKRDHLRMRGVLEEYVSPGIVDQILSGEIGHAFQPSRRFITVLMADMRASTQLTVRLEPDVTLGLMNQYLGAMTDVVFHEGGTIDRIEGDGIVALFGAPEQEANDAVRAIRTARAMQREFALLRRTWRKDYVLPERLGVGVGIASGDVIVGNIGSGKRMHYTAIGPTINLAARLAAKAPGGAIQLDAVTWRLAAPELALHDGPETTVRNVFAKGFGRPIQAYRIK